MKKTYLLTPGPTPIPENVSSVLGKQVLHHRTPEFEKLFQEVRENLKWLFQTKNEVICLASSGTGAMEAALINLFSPDDVVVTVNSGKFGERWTQIATQYGLKPVEIKLAVGEAITSETLEKSLKENPTARAVLFQASETSTGVRAPVKEIVAVCKKAGILSVCDAITAAGVFDLPMDPWGIDVLMTGSQKAMMIPPGMAFIALSDQAWIKTKTATLPRFYFDLNRELKAHLKNQTAWTPATGLIMGLHESLKMMKAEGLENIFKRHEALAQATRNAVTALGLEILSKTSPSPAVTAVIVPKTISEGKKIPKIMREKYGVTIAGGQDEMEGKIFRLSHFGHGHSKYTGCRVAKPGYSFLKPSPPLYSPQ